MVSLSTSLLFPSSMLQVALDARYESSALGALLSAMLLLPPIMLKAPSWERCSSPPRLPQTMTSASRLSSYPQEEPWSHAARSEGLRPAATGRPKVPPFQHVSTRRPPAVALWYLLGLDRKLDERLERLKQHPAMCKAAPTPFGRNACRRA